MGDDVVKNYLILKGKIEPPPPPKVTKKGNIEKPKPVEQIIDEQSDFKTIINDKPKIKVVKEYLQCMIDKLNSEFLDDD